MTDKKDDKIFWPRQEFDIFEFREEQASISREEGLQLFMDAFSKFDPDNDPLSPLRKSIFYAKSVLKEILDLPDDFEIPSSQVYFAYPEGTSVKDILIKYQVDSIFWKHPKGYKQCTFTKLPIPLEKADIGKTALEIIFWAERALRKADKTEIFKDFLSDYYFAVSRAFWMGFLLSENYTRRGEQAYEKSFEGGEAGKLGIKRSKERRHKAIEEVALDLKNQGYTNRRLIREVSIKLKTTYIKEDKNGKEVNSPRGFSTKTVKMVLKEKKII